RAARVVPQQPAPITKIYPGEGVIEKQYNRNAPIWQMGAGFYRQFPVNLRPAQETIRLDSGNAGLLVCCGMTYSYAPGDLMKRWLSEKKWRVIISGFFITALPIIGLTLFVYFELDNYIRNGV